MSDLKKKNLKKNLAYIGFVVIEQCFNNFADFFLLDCNATYIHSH